MKKVKLGVIFNTLNNPMYISYMGETLVLAPKQRVKNINKAKLGHLPKGVLYLAA